MGSNPSAAQAMGQAVTWGSGHLPLLRAHVVPQQHLSCSTDRTPWRQWGHPTVQPPHATTHHLQSTHMQNPIPSTNPRHAPTPSSGSIWVPCGWQRSARRSALAGGRAAGGLAGLCRAGCAAFPRWHSGHPTASPPCARRCASLPGLHTALWMWGPWGWELGAFRMVWVWQTPAGTLQPGGPAALGLFSNFSLPSCSERCSFPVM